MEEMHKKIEQKAYDFFLQRGMTHGNDVGDWLMAEKEVLAGVGKKSSKKKITLKKMK
ncbi:MAG: DUF2934 domain-containing protein [Spirochaetes bacterium]|nr:DUF2934 domain-containing protein [Spirochaetota bacterium]